MGETHRPRMFVGGRLHFALGRLDLDYRTMHSFIFSALLQTVERGIALILPVADPVQDIGDFEFGQILGLLVTDLGWNLQAQWGAMLAGQWPVIHLIAQQSL